jgi:hypothetical protein
MVPFGTVEVGELQRVSHNSGKPIIKCHMELRGDVASIKIEDQWDTTGVSITDADVDAVH